MSIKRVDFVECFVRSGLSYTQACRAYDNLIGVFEEAVIQGKKINIGRVASIVPTRTEPKVVHMGFKNEGGKMKKIRREYILGRRIRFKFNLHRSFVDKHPLNWFQ